MGWSAMLMISATCHNAAGLMTLRFFMGVCEAPTFPLAATMTVMWYRSDEQGLRTAIVSFSLVLSVRLTCASTNRLQWIGQWSSVWYLSFPNPIYAYLTILTWIDLRWHYLVRYRPHIYGHCPVETAVYCHRWLQFPGAYITSSIFVSPSAVASNTPTSGASFSSFSCQIRLSAANSSVIVRSTLPSTASRRIRRALRTR